MRTFSNKPFFDRPFFGLESSLLLTKRVVQGSFALDDDTQQVFKIGVGS